MSRPASSALYSLGHPYARSVHYQTPPTKQLPTEPTHHRAQGVHIPSKVRVQELPSNRTNMDVEEKQQETSLKITAPLHRGTLPSGTSGTSGTPGTPGPRVDDKQRQNVRGTTVSQPKVTTAAAVTTMTSAVNNGERPKTVSFLVQQTLDAVAASVRAKKAARALSVPLTVIAPEHHMDVEVGHAESRVRLCRANDHNNVGMRMTTVLRQDEIAELKRFHDNSLAATSRRAYTSDYHSFVGFLAIRFPDVEVSQLQQQCALEHVLAYLNHLCKDGKKISTINRRLSTIKKHILPALFNRVIEPGSREEQVAQEMDAIVRGIRRVVGGEQRIRGKRPLLVENITAMVDLAAQAVDEEDKPMPNTRCRDVSLLLFLFFSAMRRNEVSKLLWSELTFDKRGVVVQIRQSKTDKEAKGQTIALSRLDGTPKAAYCPVQALEAWKTQSGGVGESPVFRWISKKDEIQWRVLIDQRIVAIIKRHAKKIGLDEKCFAGHSTRAGYVTSSSERGVPVSEVMKRTRHKSLSSVAVYMKSEDLFQSSGDRRL
jgi:integrase